MSKKLDAVKKMVFYSHENPNALAELISDLVTDTATSVLVEGPATVKQTVNGVTANYTASVLSQFGDKISTGTLSLDGTVTGVSISGGKVTVASTVAVGTKFKVKGTSDSISATLEVIVE